MESVTRGRGEGKSSAGKCSSFCRAPEARMGSARACAGGVAEGMKMNRRHKVPAVERFPFKVGP